ncbi:predicted protein [Culex quinquefasciatus]|uniref:Predicted protein n=1 Tax=Culex quinquefasciatus TaxID=7176 RepID=B0W0H5_CULQU|nr:predicted protein [Culex quinquefasciatus]|eukprot:XP_001842209.1 predicted protein [Culex quinquefasciatus]
MSDHVSQQQQQRVMLIPTFKWMAPDAKNEYTFWRARLLHCLKQEELLYYLERIPPMEEYADGQGKDKTEELARREKYVRRLKDDNAALSLVMMTIDNKAMNHILNIPYVKLALDKLDNVYNRHSQMKTLLAAIPERYSHIMDALAVLRKNDIGKMTLNEIQGLFLDAEREATAEEESENLAMAAKRLKRRRRLDKIVCYHCGEASHKAKDCFAIKDRKNEERAQFNRFAEAPKSPARKYVQKREPSPMPSTSRKVRFEERELVPEREKFLSGKARREKFQQERANGALVAKPPGEPRTIPMVVDSGATQHMVQEGYQAKDRWAINPILIATAKEGHKIVSKSKGVYKLKLKIVKKKNEIKNNVELYEALIIPKLEYNLLSVSALASLGKRVTFDSREFVALEIKYHPGALATHADGFRGFDSRLTTIEAANGTGRDVPPL